MTPFSCLIDVHQDRETAIAIKQAALLFDHVSYIPPVGFGWKDVNEIKDRVKSVGENNYYIEDFSWFKDIAPVLSVADESLRNDELRDAVATFRAAKIASPAAYTPDAGWFKGSFGEDLRNTICVEDLKDADFVEECGSAEELKSGRIQSSPLVVSSAQGSTQTIHVVNVCKAVATCWSITELADLACTLGASPLVCRPAEISLMDRRLARCRDSLTSGNLPESLASSMAQSMVGVEETIARIDALFPREIVAEMSAKDVLSARRAFNDAREDLLARYFCELDELVAEKCQGQDQRVRLFEREKLRPALLKFKQEQSAFRDKWLGQALNQGVSLATGAAFGGGIGYLASHALPLGGLPAVFLVGMLGGVGRQAPNLIKNLTEFLIDYRKRKRSGLSYILHIEKYKR